MANRPEDLIRKADDDDTPILLMSPIIINSASYSGTGEPLMQITAYSQEEEKHESTITI
jgi:hypothetical protein